jgi:hypothetical protein
VVTIGAGIREAFELLEPMLPAALAALTDDQLVGFTTAAERLSRHADALRLACAREFDNRTDPSLGDESLARRLGARNAAEAVETVTRTSAEDARRRVVEARNLAKLPVLAEAVARGLLARAQAAEIIAPLLPALPVADPAAVRTACEQLAEIPAAIPATAVVEAARAWAAVLDPDGVEPVEKSAMEKRFVQLGRARNGLVKLTGLLPIEQAAAIRAVLDAYVNPRAGTAVAFTPTAEHNGEGKPLLVATLDEPPADTRTAGQKRADVLHTVFAAQARASDVPTMGGAHPTVIVTVTRENLDARTGTAWIDGEVEPLSAAAAARVADSGGYQEVELGPNGEVISLGRTQRCFSPAQRRALAVRDRGCVIPGCDIPARWCEAHHVEAHRDGGPTDLGNAALLCWFHHHDIDDGPYRLRMVAGMPEVRWVFGSHASAWTPAAHQARHGARRAPDGSARSPSTGNPSTLPRAE